MNFRTTIFLLAFLAVAGTVTLVVHYRQISAPTDVKDERKLVDLGEKDLRQVMVTPAGGKRMVLEKTGIEWRLTEPVAAPADSFAVDSLVSALGNMKVRDQVEGGDANAMGTANPRYAVELQTADKTFKFNVGNRSVVGNNLYVQLAGDKKVAVVAGDLMDQLEKPYTNFRQSRLFSAAAANIRQIEISKPDLKLVLQKPGNDWEVVSPQKMPAEASEISDITSAITSLSAAEFVDESDVPAALLPKSNSKLTIWFSTDAPTTRPTTAPVTVPTTRPAGTTIIFGGYDNNLRKNVYVAVSNPPALMKVAASSMESFNKKPIDLRDKRVLDVEPAQVSKLVVITDTPPTTQPTTKAASKSELTLERKKQSLALGPEMPLIALPTSRPTTRPTTGPAATQAATTQPTTQVVATQPALPPSNWTMNGKGDGEDAKVEALLERLHPLRVDKYIPGPLPTTQPTARYVVRVWTEAAGGAKSGQYEFRRSDQGAEKPLIGEYNGLLFELTHTFLESITGDFANKPRPPAPPSPPANLPFGFPGQ
jgi:uncharacterized protein DUF4340